VADLAQDPAGNLWVATWGDGLYQYNGSDWTQFLPENTSMKLPSAYVSSIYIEPTGEVWVGTEEAGAAMFDGDTWFKYAVKDGLPHYNVTDIYVDNVGDVWFATETGITRYQRE
jgi:ligand-binding sensor domain-containing protein